VREGVKMKLYEIIKLYHSGGILEPVQRRIATMLPLLNERQRRLFLACEARALGSGGVSEVCKMSGAAALTVRRGLEELETIKHTGFETGRSRKRRPGKTVKTRYPDIMKDLEGLIETPASAGGRYRALSYTGKSTLGITRELREKGLSVSIFAVRNLLKDAGYSLQAAGRKSAIKRSHPDLEAQFKYIDKKARLYMGRGEAVLYIEAFERRGGKDGGGRLVYDAGLPEKGLPEAAPSGVYKKLLGAGLASAGLEGDMIGFAVESMRRWWGAVGREYYGGTRRILVTADFCGGGGVISGLQELADGLGMEITGLCFPPGATRWERVGHRFFSFGGEGPGAEPAVSAAVVISLVSAAGIKPGLAADYVPDYRAYKTGGGEPDIKAHGFHGEWNYTVLPKRKNRKRGRPKNPVGLEAGPGQNG
jgi:transposase